MKIDSFSVGYLGGIVTLGMIIMIGEALDLQQEWLKFLFAFAVSSACYFVLSYLAKRHG